MSVNSLYTSFLTLCLFLTFNFAICTEFVPAFIWETAKSDELVPALPRVSKETFKEIIRERLAKEPLVVIFAEPSLSPEDFSKVDALGKKTFPHLSEIKSSVQATYLPFVEDPIGVVKELHNSEVTQVSLQEFLDNPVIPKKSLLIVNLNDVQDDETRITMLQRHDKSINKIYQQLLKDNDNVLAILTSRHTSWIIPEEISIRRQERSVTREDETETDTRKLFTTTNFLLYVNSAAVLYIDEISFDLNTFMESQIYNADNGSLNIILNSTENDAPTVTFYLTFASGYWLLTDITVTQDANDTFYFVVRNIAAPTQFSYQCTSQVFYSPTDSNKYISLPGMQLQAFTNRENDTFGDAYFCVGFTSAPIWSGLFVTAILAIIMSIGLSMIMDIKTMDRFDDPKGKTIIINASE